MQPIRTLAFVINEQKPGAAELADVLIDIARKSGVEVKDTRSFPVAAGFLEGCDACCVIGGDGTLLGVVAQAARSHVPLIGVNRGSLGFLTTFSADEARAQFQSLVGGTYRVAHRSLLECSFGPGRHELALNDVLLKDEFSSRLIRLEVRADDELVTEYSCDGLIFSTPTGSTAYNLSAGGPLIHPGAEVVAMTPICPHTLSNRSIIFRHDVKLKVYNRTASPRLLVATDGYRHIVSTDQKPIEISLSALRLPLIQACDHSHFAVVRTKLKWSGASTPSAASGVS